MGLRHVGYEVVVSSIPPLYPAYGPVGPRAEWIERIMPCRFEAKLRWSFLFDKAPSRHRAPEFLDCPR